MTIKEALHMLMATKNKHNNEDIKVYFDCPNCETSFTPGRIVETSIHVKGKKE